MVPLRMTLTKAILSSDLVGNMLNAGLNLVGAPGNQGNQGESRNGNFLGGMLG